MLLIICTLFLLWALAFILRSSTIAIDGKRYFVLFDDAMVSMRYAWNFSHGLGLVWNQGEFIQGYTNLLMTLWMSIATTLFDKSTAVLVIQLSGLVFLITTAYVTVKISENLISRAGSKSGKYLLPTLVFWGALAYYPLIFWTLMGMETGMLTLFLSASVLLTFRYTKTKNLRYLFLLSLATGLTNLTRNDTLVFTTILWIYILWDFAAAPSHSKRNLLPVLSAIVFSACFISAQLIFQRAYYGEFLSNTYALKLTGMPFDERIKNGLGFVQLFIRETGVVWAIVFMDLIFDFRREKLLLLALGLSAIGYQVYVGGDVWNYWRILAPIMPFLFILYGKAVLEGVSSFLGLVVVRKYMLRNPIFPKKYIFESLVAGVFFVTLVSINFRFGSEILLLSKPLDSDATAAHLNTAIVLSQVTDEHATVGVFWAGTLPYYLDRRAIDFLGKSDRHIAELPPDLSGAISRFGMNSVPGHNKYDLNYSIKLLRPTYIQGFRYGTQDLFDWVSENYVVVGFEGERIGPTLAQAIVNYRESHGGFDSVEDLQNVVGIGPKTFDGIKSLVTVVP